MQTVNRKFGHFVVGPVHRVEPSGASADALRDALEHERHECGAVRILVDLTSRTELSDEEVELLVEYAGSDRERWTIRLAHDADPDLIRRLCEAGLDGHLIQDSGVLDLPHQVGREG
jgi:hypothetical protein